MGNPARFRIFGMTSFAAWLGLALLYAQPAHASASCAEKVELARERFRGAVLPTPREAEQNCAHSRRAAFDRDQQRSRCIGAWKDLRDARDRYISTLADGCRATEAKAKACAEQTGQAEAQTCLEEVARAGAEAEARAHDELLKALARADEIREQFGKRYNDLDEDRRFLEGKNPDDPDVAPLAPRAREFGARSLRDYGNQARLVGHEQQMVANGAFLFREVAEFESADRLSAQRSLTGASRTAAQRGVSLGGGGVPGEGGKGSTITGRTEAAASLPAVPPMMMPQQAQGAQGGQAAAAQASLPTAKPAVLPSSEAALPAPDRVPASLARSARNQPTPEKDEGLSGKKEPGNARSPSHQDASFEAGTPRGSGGSAADRGQGSPRSGKPATGSASQAQSPTRAVATRAQKKPSAHGSSEDPGHADAAPLAPGGSHADAPAALMGTSGQLGPSEMVMKEEGELTPEQLLGLGDLKGDAPLTAEEMALLGFGTAAGPVEAKAARAALSAQLRALGQSGAAQSGIGSVDSVGIFVRVRNLHLRAQKKGLVQQITRKL